MKRRTIKVQTREVPDAPIQRLVDVATRNLIEYGTETIENRSIPDYRDGCKPAHRAVLWAMYRLGLNSSKPFKKSARTIGETIGKYHPHGDQALYDVMVGLSGTKDDANKIWRMRHVPVPLIQGQGNWGDNVEAAAAMRYTEARLSKFADLMLLDPAYMAVVPKIPNYSGDDQLPLYLPAKLPILLLEGYFAIGTGAKAECPSFDIKGVLDAVRALLVNDDIPIKDLTKMLKVTTPYGGICTSPLKEIGMLIKTGVGQLTFRPEMSIVSDKEINITSVCPGMQSQNTIQTAMDKIAGLKAVQSVTDASGKFLTRYVVRLSRGHDSAAVLPQLERLLTRRLSYNVGITIKQMEGAKFRRSSIVSILKAWVKWRVSLEVKVIRHTIKNLERRLFRLQTILLAVDCLEIIFKALRQKDTKAYLIKHMKITDEQAELILEMKVRQLKALERQVLVTQIKEVEKSIASENRDLKKPNLRVDRQLAAFDFSIV